MRQLDRRTILSCLFILVLTAPSGLTSPVTQSLNINKADEISSSPAAHMSHDHHPNIRPRDDWRNYQEEDLQQQQHPPHHQNPPLHHNTPIDTPEMSDFDSDSEMGETISSTSGSEEPPTTNNENNNTPDQHILPQPIPPPHPSSPWQYTVTNYNFPHARPPHLDLSLIIARLITGILAQFPFHQDIPRESFWLPVRADGMIGHAATRGTRGRTGPMMMRLVITVAESMGAYTWGDLVEALGVLGRYADVPYERDAIFVFARMEPGRKVADAYFQFAG